MTPLYLVLLAMAGLFSGMYHLLKPTQEPPVVESVPAPIDYTSERAWLLECLRRKPSWSYHVEQISGECHTIEIHDFSGWKSSRAGRVEQVYQANFYMMPTTSEAVKKLIRFHEPGRTSDLLKALAADELAESRRRELRVRRLRRESMLVSIPLPQILMS